MCRTDTGILTAFFLIQLNDNDEIFGKMNIIIKKMRQMNMKIN